MMMVDFSRACLREADFARTVIFGADFTGADLSAADLTTANGLTAPQLESASGSTETRLPPELEGMAPRAPE